MGDNFDSRYDGLLGQDFWKSKGDTIDYCNCVIIIGELIMNFDGETNETIGMTHTLTLRSRTEGIVRLPTKSKEIIIISKRIRSRGVFSRDTDQRC